MQSSEHIAFAERIEGFEQRIPIDLGYRDRAVIALFYAALHYVEAFLVTKTTSYRNHEIRRLRMREHHETDAIMVDYHVLHQAAEEARYHGTPFRQDDLDRLRARFLKVKGAMRNALGL